VSLPTLFTAAHTLSSCVSYVVISFPCDVTANSSGHQDFFYLVIRPGHMLEQNSDTHLGGMFSDDNIQLRFKMNSVMLASLHCLPRRLLAPPVCLSTGVLVRISNGAPILAMKAYMGSRGIALLIRNLGARWCLSGQHHAPTAVPSRKNPQYPVSRRRLGRPWSPNEYFDEKRSLVLGVIQNLHRQCRCLACIEYRTAVPTKILNYLIYTEV